MRPAAEQSSERRGLERFAPALLALCVLGLWSTSLRGPFVFDDLPGIVHNPHIESLTPLSRALSAPPGTGASGRPLVALTLALNYALGGREPLGYHAFNVLVHLASALLLLHVVRCALELRGVEARTALACGFGLALVWSTHPLHSATLNHVIQRNGALASCFYLACIHGLLRGLQSGSRRWLVWSVSACWLGALSKETLATAPLVCLLIDRCVSAASWRAALKERGRYYLGLCGTWALLAALVLTGDRGDSTGFDVAGVSSLDYLRTQAGVIAHYLKLTFWPAQLALDYQGWPIARSLEATLPYGPLIAIAALSAFALALRGRRVAAVLAIFFILLAPTSSFVPLAGAIAAEHRMYLPLAALLLALGLALHRLVGGRAAMVVALGASGALATRTVLRNQDFATAVAVWESNTRTRPDGANGWNSYAVALHAAGRTPEALVALEEALRLNPAHYKALINLGNRELERGQLARAVELFARAVDVAPRATEGHYYLASAYSLQGEHRRATEHFERVLAGPVDPRLVQSTLQQLAWLLATSPQAEVRNGSRALQLAEQLVAQSNVRQGLALDTLAAAQAELGEYERAQSTLDRALAAVRGARNPRRPAMLERRKRYAAGKPWRSVPTNRQEKQ